MVNVLGFFLGMFIVFAVVFYAEAKNAIVVDEKEPFLHDDYNPKEEAN